MQLHSALKGEAAPFLVYTIDPNSWGKKAYCIRNLGCAFPVRSDGLLATCSHIFESINTNNEMIVVQHPTETVCHKINTVKKHPKFDFAIMEIDATFNLVPTAILGELPLAISTFSYGFYDSIIENGELNSIPQVYSGTITATPRRFKNPLQTLLPFYQISFPCLPGFSGSPLYAGINNGFALSGMVFGNESSQVVERYLTEYDDGTGKVIEKISRIFESGTAHTCDSIKSFSHDLGFTIWENDV